MPVKVAWIFSLPRSGSSITAYAAAAPFGHAVADEVLGPWDRTGEPYRYPPLQRDLMRAYHGNRCQLTPEVVGMALELFEQLGDRTGVVVSKHPHLRPPPEEFRRAFPGHRAVWLIRNPLKRLNSLYARGWTQQLRPNFELDHYRAFADHWASQADRLVFEHLRRDPRRYFARLYRAWNWSYTGDDLDRAAAYREHHYHGSSATEEQTGGDSGAVSESVWCLPEAALDTYLSDPGLRRLMRRCQWPRSRAAYRDDPRDPPLERWVQRRLGRRPATIAAPGVASRRRVAGPAADRGVDGPASPRLAEVVWLFSLARSGSSVTAYAAAAPRHDAVADEVFGPWNRTVAPYNYPPDQERLRQLFKDSGERPTPEVVVLATRLLHHLAWSTAGRTGRVICKIPHLQFDPGELAAAFPGAGGGPPRAVYLLRNPLHRLNSLHARGWLNAIAGRHDLEVYTAFARRWLAAEHRVTYDELVRDPRAYFGAVYRAWGWSCADEDLDAASAYAAGHYHSSSAALDPSSTPRATVSERSMALTPEIVGAYLGDPFIRDVMGRCGWSTDPASYLAPRAGGAVWESKPTPAASEQAAGAPAPAPARGAVT